MKHKMTTGQKLLIAILLITLIAAVILGLYAWSKYVTTIPGETTAKVAKWHFDLKNTEGESLAETGTIDLAETLDFEHVKTDRIAPGTSGQFEMVVDTTGTEVSLVYKIEVALTNCPTNLNFYTSDSYVDANKISKDGDKLVFEKYLSKEEAYEYEETITVHWNWPYETKDANNSTVAGDEEDKKFNGQPISMAITATGTEVLKEPEKTLSYYVQNGDIHVGDFIDYNPAKGTYQEITVEVDETGYDTPQEFTTENSTTKWRVLKVDKASGTIEIIPADGSGKSLTLGTKGNIENCKTAFLNSEEVINKVCEIYGYGYGAKSARSIDIGDIEQYSKYEYKDYPNSTSNTEKWGGTYEYTTGSYFLKEIVEGEGDDRKVIGYEGEGDKKDQFVKAPITMTQTYYYYTANTNQFEDVNEYYTIFKQADNSSNKKGYWLASRCVDLTSASACNFHVRFVNSGGVYANTLFDSVGDTRCPSFEVCPVVTLDSNIPIKETEQKRKMDIRN